MRCDAREDIGEPGLRVDAVHFRGDDEAVPGDVPKVRDRRAGRDGGFRRRGRAGQERAG